MQQQTLTTDVIMTNLDFNLLINSLAQPLCVISVVEMKILYFNISFDKIICGDSFGMDFAEILLTSEYDRKHLAIQLLDLSVENSHSTILAVTIKVKNGW